MTSLPPLRLPPWRYKGKVWRIKVIFRLPGYGFHYQRAERNCPLTIYLGPLKIFILVIDEEAYLRRKNMTGMDWRVQLYLAEKRLKKESDYMEFAGRRIEWARGKTLPLFQKQQKRE